MDKKTIFILVGLGVGVIAIWLIYTTYTAVTRNTTKNIVISASGFNKTTPTLASLSSVNKPEFTPSTTNNIDYILSGAPEYMTVKLKSIDLKLDGKMFNLWKGSTDLKIESGKIDTTSIQNSLNNPPAGTITEITLEFDSVAKIKGKLSGSVYSAANLQGLLSLTNISTKTALKYNPITHTGGANSYAEFLSDTSEEMDIYLSNQTSFSVTTASETVITSSVSNPLTLSIVFDLNRSLRWYSGGGSNGVNPGDLTDKAYFFTHSLLGSNIACFFGAAGQLQGYKTVYAPTNSNVSISGWMTLIFDFNGKFLSGFLMPDSDNTLTISKGKIIDYNTDFFQYDIAKGKVLNFIKTTNMNEYTNLLDFQVDHPSSEITGKCYFQLQYVMEFFS